MVGLLLIDDNPGLSLGWYLCRNPASHEWCSRRLNPMTLNSKQPFLNNNTDHKHLLKISFSLVYVTKRRLKVQYLVALGYPSQNDRNSQPRTDKHQILLLWPLIVNFALYLNLVMNSAEITQSLFPFPFSFFFRDHLLYLILISCLVFQFLPLLYRDILPFY